MLWSISDRCKQHIQTWHVLCAHYRYASLSNYLVLILTTIRVLRKNFFLIVEWAFSAIGINVILIRNYDKNEDLDVPNKIAWISLFLEYIRAPLAFLIFPLSKIHRFSLNLESEQPVDIHRANNGQSTQICKNDSSHGNSLFKNFIHSSRTNAMCMFRSNDCILYAVILTVQDAKCQMEIICRKL